MVFGYGYMKFISQLVDHWRHDIHRFPNGSANVRIIGEIPVSKNRDISLPSGSCLLYHVEYLAG